MNRCDVYFCLLPLALILMGTLCVPAMKVMFLHLFFSSERTNVSWGPLLPVPHSLNYCLMDWAGALVIRTSYLEQDFHKHYPKLSTGILLSDDSESLRSTLGHNVFDWIHTLIHQLACWQCQDEQFGIGGSHRYHRSTLGLLMAIFPLLLSAGSFGHDLLWRLIFTKDVSWPM